MLNYILLAAQQQSADGQGQSQWTFWIMMILLFVIMWAFMIRPMVSVSSKSIGSST